MSYYAAHSVSIRSFQAIDKFGRTKFTDLTLNDPTTLSKVLYYHVVKGRAMRKDFKNGVIKSVNNDNIRIGVLPTGTLLVNDSANITKSYKATNGIVHIIDEVLIPPKTLVDTILSDSRFSTLGKAVKAAGLVNTLKSSSKDFTIFAPTNTAFQALGTNTVNALLKDPNTLKSILLYHTISGSNLKSDLKALGSTGSIKTFQGSQLKYRFTKDVLSINNSTVVEANIIASNGVIHEINKVLTIPK